jgi:hypothetical protein
MEPGRGGGETFTFKVEPDGSFRIEDIEADSYELQLRMNNRPVDPSEGPLGTQTIATARREVVVPPMPGGRSDEPLDLGTIPVTVVAKREAAPAQQKADRFPPPREPLPAVKRFEPAPAARQP